MFLNVFLRLDDDINVFCSIFVFSLRRFQMIWQWEFGVQVQESLEPKIQVLLAIPILLNQVIICIF